MLEQLLVALIATIPSLIALYKIRELHILINSRLTELLNSVRIQSHAEGVLEGKSDRQQTG
jgi:hypothetical protein